MSFARFIFANQSDIKIFWGFAFVIGISVDTLKDTFWEWKAFWETANSSFFFSFMYLCFFN